jgi:hypothetical protein
MGNLKAKFLHFESEDVARILDGEIKDGCVVIDGKQYILDTSSPKFLKTKFGYTPLYITKWNVTEPASNIHKPNPKGLQRFDPKFKERYDITPEMLRKLMGLKILGNMIKTKEPIGGWLWLILGLIAGIGILYSLIILKVIPIHF